MDDDPFLGLEDSFDVEPPELEPLYSEVLVSTIAKRLATNEGLQWTEKQETELQERIAKLVSAAKNRGLSTIKMIVTKKATGAKEAREIDLNLLARERKLQ